MNRVKLLPLCGAIFLTLMLSGCSGDISTFVIPVSRLPKNLDAQVATSAEEIVTLTNIFDGLYEFVDGEAMPNIADSCEISSDGLQYTFKLKNTSSFYRKKEGPLPVTARDFVFSFKRILDPETRSAYYNDFKNILNVEAIGDYTLRIELSRPDKNFLDKLCLTAATPCNEEFFKATKGAYGLGVKQVLSNGPFSINYIAEDDSYATLVRTTPSKGALDRIRLRKVEKDSDEAALFKGDKISGFFQFGSSNAKIDGIKKDFASLGTELIFNLEKDIFKNENIRKSLAHYAFALENSGANLAAVDQSFSLFSDNLTFGAKAINEQITAERPQYMLQNAKQLCQQGLAELGVSKLSGVTLLVPNDSKYSVVFENINQLWQKELGQFFSIELLPTQEILDRIYTGDFDMAFVGIVPKVNSPFEVLDSYAQYDSDIQNFTASAHRNTGAQAMLSDIEKAQNIAMDRAYAVPACKSPTSYWHHKAFESIVINPFGNVINLKYAQVK